jgi:hypothetical protein
LWLSRCRGISSKTARKTPNPQLAVTQRNCVTLDGDAAVFANETILAGPSIRQLDSSACK